MSRQVTLFIAAVLLASASFDSEVMAESTMSVSEIRCESKVSPLGIDTKEPRFSWKLSDNLDTPGQCQTAYRILVSKSRKDLDRNKGGMWDSGIVESPQSMLVGYAGKALSSRVVQTARAPT